MHSTEVDSCLAENVSYEWANALAYFAEASTTKEKKAPRRSS
jgi:hypothetical protein